MFLNLLIMLRHTNQKKKKKNKGCGVIVAIKNYIIHGDTLHAGLHYINNTLLLVPNTEAALPCWSACVKIRIKIIGAWTLVPSSPAT